MRQEENHHQSDLHSHLRTGVRLWFHCHFRSLNRYPARPVQSAVRIPLGLLAGILESIVEGLLFGAQGSFILANVCRMIAALLIPSLLSNKIRTNLSSSGTPTVKGIILALIPTEIVNYIATILYIWIMFILPYEGSTFNPYPTLYTLASFIITIAVVTPIVMLLNANKSNPRSRNRRSFDDER